MMEAMAAAFAIAAVLAIAVAVRAWRQGAALGQELTRGLEALSGNRPVWPIRPQAWSPWNRLIAAFNAIAMELETKVRDLESDRRQMRAVLEAMIEGVIVVDDGRRLNYANTSAERLFGLSRAAAGRPIPELIRSPSIRQAIDATLAQSSGEPYKGEAVLAAFDASAKVFAVYGMPMPGPPREAVLVFHEITELRRLERMRQDFVANVSHELKTPLASIRAYAETLLDWGLDDPAVNRKYLAQVDQQAERLEWLIQDLLRLARIESAQDIFDHQPMALAPLVRERVNSFRDRARAKNLAISLECRIKDADQIRADEEAALQILDNLIDNAIKYGSSAKGWVKIVCRSDLDGEALAVDVIDNGPGIPVDEQDRIFERFYRVDKARSRELGGTGLGLSIVKHLVQALGAAIEVQSRVGAGSRFTVRFPRWSGG